MNVDAAEYGSDEQRRQPVHGESCFQTRLRKENNLVGAEIIIHWHKQRITKKNECAARTCSGDFADWDVGLDSGPIPARIATDLGDHDQDDGQNHKRAKLAHPCKVGLLSCFPLTSLACSEWVSSPASSLLLTL